MELAGIIVNFGIFVATVIAAIIAWRSVVNARAASVEAADSAKRATTAAVDSAKAQERIADATERHANLVEAAATPREPWRLTNVSEYRWELTNMMGVDVDMVHLESVPRFQLQLEDESDWRDVGNGASIYFYFASGYDDPPSLNVTVAWRQPGHSGRLEWTRSIS